MKTNKTYIKWKTILENKAQGQPWTEHEIIYFRKAIGMAGIKDAELRHKLKNMFFELMPIGGYNITNEQSQKGTNYLLKNSYKLNGQLRKNNIFGDRELNILKNCFEHKLIDLYQYNQAEYYSPVYSAIDTDGNSFDYLGVSYSMIRIVG